MMNKGSHCFVIQEAKCTACQSLGTQLRWYKLDEASLLSKSVTTPDGSLDTDVLSACLWRSESIDVQIQSFC